MKRLFDIIAASLGLLLLAPLLIVIAVLIKTTSPGAVIFRQRRVGRQFKPFFILKFRTMVPDAAAMGGQLTVGDDARITSVGRLLRKTKLDELPQLINVLIGNMSFVGPRPEVPKYVEMFRTEYEQILQVRPGVTDLASLTYRNEAAILGQSDNPEQEYIQRLLPDKLALARDYVSQQSLMMDVKIILLTIWKLFRDRITPINRSHDSCDRGNHVPPPGENP